MRQFELKKNAGGFTMIELIVYMGIVSMVLVAIFYLAIAAQNSHYQFIVRSQLHQSTQRVLDTVDFLVRNADGFVEDASGNDCFSSSELWLYFSTSSISFVPQGCMKHAASGAVGISIGGGSASHGVYLTCYHDYPNNGKAASCVSDPPNDSTFEQSLFDSSFLFVGAGDLRFATTTARSRAAIETQISMGFSGQEIGFDVATLTASTTSIFRIVP